MKSNPKTRPEVPNERRRMVAHTHWMGLVMTSCFTWLCRTCFRFLPSFLPSFVRSFVRSFLPSFLPSLHPPGGCGGCRRAGLRCAAQAVKLRVPWTGRGIGHPCETRSGSGAPLANRAFGWSSGTSSCFFHQPFGQPGDCRWACALKHPASLPYEGLLPLRGLKCFSLEVLL